jgi:hypothetical protein
LSGEAHKKMASIQDVVPARESILAWVSMSMDLDFRRNEIYPTYEYGISNSLLVMPLAKGADAMRRYFRQRGIRYFMWEYNGYGMKSQARYGGFQRKFIKVLTDFLSGSRILYNDGGIIVFDIGQGS